MVSKVTDAIFKSAVNTENPIKVSAEQLEERITNLNVGSILVFVNENADIGDTRNWFGVQCCCAFGREFYIVARYYDGLCDIWDWNLNDEELIDKITSLLWNRKEQKADDVVVFEENKQNVDAVLFTDGSTHLIGYTNWGAEINLPPVLGHDIFEATRIFYVEEDIKQRLVDSENVNAERISSKDISKMAGEVISLEDNNDAISEHHWSIIDDTIKKFIEHLTRR